MVKPKDLFEIDHKVGKIDTYLQDDASYRRPISTEFLCQIAARATTQ